MLLKINNDKLDVYAGAGLGYRTISISGISLSGSDLKGSGLTNIFIPIHVGGRYYFNEKVAGFAELGTGFAILHVGATFKF